MPLSWWQFAAVTLAAGRVASLPASYHSSNASMPAVLSMRQVAYDPDDLSHIKSLAAIGDSYSAGIGAGDRLGSIVNALDPHSAWACSRYSHSYPMFVDADPRLGDPKSRKWQFESCSGAVTNDVVENQIPRIDGSQDAILLSAGGNDVQLLEILNQCIFQWAVLTDSQVLIAKAAALKEGIDWAEDYDWDKLAVGCDGQLAASDKLIDSSVFAENLDKVIDAAKSKLSSDGMVYMTGYAKFFAEDLSPSCEDVTWSTWINELYNKFALDKAYLTINRRRRMNELVDKVNKKLWEAVKRAGNKVKFVDYDKYVGYHGGRYCEDGVDESTNESNTRIGLMFYELNSWDPFGSTPWKRSNGDSLSHTFDGQQDMFAQITLLLEPDAEFAHQDRFEGDTASVASVSAADNDTVEAAGLFDIQVPGILPDGYGRVFHPQILLHSLIADRIVFEMVNTKLEKDSLETAPEVASLGTCELDPSNPTTLRYKGTKGGKEVKPGTKLRILGVGDSITVGFLSDRNGGDGNGYRRQLKSDLSKDEVVFAGTETMSGTMSGNRFAAWSGQTIKYIDDHVENSLKQRPNIVLVHAGTNDMNPSLNIAKEGNDPAGAADRLGKLLDKIIKACPDATVLVGMIINTCDPNQSPRTKEYQALIPGVVKKRKDAGHHILAADFTSYETDHLQDCIHPTNDGYKLFGSYWYDFITQIPKDWIKKPVGDDPKDDGGDGANGGLDGNIPAPDWGPDPVTPTTPEKVGDAYINARPTETYTCNAKPQWHATGQIALGNVGRNGDWKFKKHWVEAGKVADGLGRDPRYVRLHDMNGDGKADYVWIHPDTGEIRCWINNLPEPWSKAGNNDDIIGSGAGPADSVFLADMNGDGLDDYMVVNPNNGAVKIWWNYGPDDSWVNGWKFVEGGEIASGVPHANLKTLRFPDINGDGRADYVYIGKGGALKHHLNTGSAGGEDVLFLAQGGIATGAVSDISRLVFADLNGDGRDDYLIWDDDAGLTGFLNQPTQKEGVPVYIDQGPAKTLADGISQKPDDGMDDYAYIDDNGAIWLWYNRGTGDTSMLIDGLHFADINGDGTDDYVWLEPETGAPIVYLSDGLAKKSSEPLGWDWIPLNGAKPIASGAAPASQVIFGDVTGDGMDDYIVVDPKTGKLSVWMNMGEDKDTPEGWRWQFIDIDASGLGPGKNVRIADIDGDGWDDYIYLNEKGGTKIYRNMYLAEVPVWKPLPEADAEGISQRPEEISFHDINGDGKADYVWTRAHDGAVFVWLNNYPNQPAWLPQGQVADGWTSGSFVRWASMYVKRFKKLVKPTSSYIAVRPKDGAVAAWMNGCRFGDHGPPTELAPHGDVKTSSLEGFGNFSDPVVNSSRPLDKNSQPLTNISRPLVNARFEKMT
ncbi:hypothetical protein CPLU01_05731 [Colletotrichum plurivorum]|uniref:SGNH hydrolase-type esterase domain-containing protein n=1 Tax=Colletotrichum plurivorum TaxID=2175906 RepID=A0A8H6KKJ2_9PEZI|nr:hypothetical protein CPLU01_05731 [Colletotrichum plurivorum]